MLHMVKPWYFWEGTMKISYIATQFLPCVLDLLKLFHWYFADKMSFFSVPQGWHLGVDTILTFSHSLVYVYFRTKFISPLCPSVRNASPQNRPGHTTAASATRKMIKRWCSCTEFLIYFVFLIFFMVICLCFIKGAFWRWTTTVVSFWQSNT